GYEGPCGPPPHGGRGCVALNGSATPISGTRNPGIDRLTRGGDAGDEQQRSQRPHQRHFSRDAPDRVKAAKYPAMPVDHMHLVIQCVAVEMTEFASDARIRQSDRLDASSQIEDTRKTDEAAALAAAIVEQHGQRHNGSSTLQRYNA